MEMALAVGIVFCLLGVVVLVKLVQRKRWAARAALWPSVPGVIVESRVDFAQPGSGHDDTLAFLYRYEVAGELFGRRRVGLFDGAAIGTERMQAIARDYPAGREVAVFYDPARPGDSVLEPTSQAGFAQGMWLPWLLIVAGIAFSWLAGQADGFNLG